jgi:hypothetical protein
MLKPAGRLFVTARSEAGMTGSGLVKVMVSVLMVRCPMGAGSNPIVAEGGCADAVAP